MKKIPEFKNEDDERKFWATADSTEYLEWPSAKRRKLVHLKPSLKTILSRSCGEPRIVAFCPLPYDD